MSSLMLCCGGMLPPEPASSVLLLPSQQTLSYHYTDVWLQNPHLDIARSLSSVPLLFRFVSNLHLSGIHGYNCVFESFHSHAYLTTVRLVFCLTADSPKPLQNCRILQHVLNEAIEMSPKSQASLPAGFTRLQWTAEHPVRQQVPLCAWCSSVRLLFHKNVRLLSPLV